MPTSASVVIIQYMARIILHIDMDAFFAQVEERENPHFKGKPVVVGAEPKNGKGRGVVSTANYEARKYGIHSAMPISSAWKACPTAIFLPVNGELYLAVSQKIMEIVKGYSPVFEQVSSDEAYLDLSPFYAAARKGDETIFWKKAEGLAKELKKEILERERLTCTVGIGPNKMIAKIAANKGKPNGLKVITPDKVAEFLDPLDIEEIQGIGPKTAAEIRRLGINTIKELKGVFREKLQGIFGVVGEAIYERAWGIDEGPVTSERPVKSISNEHTFEKDTRNPEIIFNAFEKIIGNIHQEVLKDDFLFRTITVVCRFSGFETHTKAITLKQFTDDIKIFKKEAKKLLLKFLLENPKPIRLVGSRVSSFREKR